MSAVAGVPPTLRFEDDELYLLDQRLLPHKQEYLQISNAQELHQAIVQLSVRGAPAIGVAAGYGMARCLRDTPADQMLSAARDLGDYIKSARPTAVNLAWAVDRQLEALRADCSYAQLKHVGAAIHAEDVAMCNAIGEHGAELIEPGARLLTHCNAGALATSHTGTATAPMYWAHARGVQFSVYADETRPLYQGARLTAWELSNAGIEVTLICDNNAASLMAAGQIDLVIVGTDRVVANGDVVNKVGTLNLAVLCRHFGVPFYVACPMSTFDPGTPTGAEVEIEQRHAAEVLGDHGAQVNVHNASFDVTPASLVTGIITNQGLAKAPLEQTLRALHAQNEAAPD